MKKILLALLAPLLAFAQPTPPTTSALNVNKTTGLIQNNAFTLQNFKDNNGLGGGGAPGGSSGDIQYNNAGSFGGRAVPLAFTYGGTGATTLTNHGVVVAGASALSTVAPGTSGNVLTSNGTDWTSAANTGGVSSITGTAGQITASAATGAVTLSIPTAMTGITSVTAPAATDYTITGGSTGAVITAGQGASGNVTLAPKGTGYVINSFTGDVDHTLSVTKPGSTSRPNLVSKSLASVNGDASLWTIYSTGTNIDGVLSTKPVFGWTFEDNFKNGSVFQDEFYFTWGSTPVATAVRPMSIIVNRATGATTFATRAATNAINDENDVSRLIVNSSGAYSVGTAYGLQYAVNNAPAVMQFDSTNVAENLLKLDSSNALNVGYSGSTIKFIGPITTGTLDPFGGGSGKASFTSATNYQHYDFSGAAGTGTSLDLGDGVIRRAQISAELDTSGNTGVIKLRTNDGGSATALGEALWIDHNQQVQVKASTTSTSTTTGALVVAGGAGVAGPFFGTTGVFGSATSLLLGTPGSAVGSIGFRNATSGTVTLAPPTGALGTYQITLPNAASTLPIFGQQATFTGLTAARSYAMPDAAATIARTDAGQTFTGVNNFTSPDITTSVTTSSTSFTAFAGATTLLTWGGTGASASNFAPSTLDATSSTTGAIRTSGGISAAKALNVGTTITGGGAFSIGTSNPATVGTIELGAATDTTLSRNSAGVIAVEGAVVLTNKVLSAASYTTDTGTSLNCDTMTKFIVTAQAGALLINTPSGTPVDGQTLWIAITGTAARALTWGAGFETSGGGATLPTTTVTTQRTDVGVIYRSDTSKWRCVAVQQ